MVRFSFDGAAKRPARPPNGIDGLFAMFRVYEAGQSVFQSPCRDSRRAPVSNPLDPLLRSLPGEPLMEKYPIHITAHYIFVKRADFRQTPLPGLTEISTLSQISKIPGGYTKYSRVILAGSFLGSRLES